MNVLRIRNEMRNGKTIFDLPLRVTFYARVSTDKDEQINSLENQVQYYSELIQSKPNWTFVPGYIDERIILGTSQEVLAPQGFPDLVLIFIWLEITGP